MAITTTPPAEVLVSMRAILDYDWATELRDYEEQGEPEGHVFEHLLRVNRWLEEDQPEPTAFAHVVEVFDRTDGIYVFADLDDAKAFETTVSSQPFGSEASCYRTEETVCDRAMALKLIAAECEASEAAIAASLESGVPVASHAWRKGEDAPYPDKLLCVEYTCYRAGGQEDDGQKPRKQFLWVGLDPDIGAPNVDAGRERLEELGWEVTDWRAA